MASPRYPLRRNLSRQLSDQQYHNLGGGLQPVGNRRRPTRAPGLCVAIPGVARVSWLRRVRLGVRVRLGRGMMRFAVIVRRLNDRVDRRGAGGRRGGDR